MNGMNRTSMYVWLAGADGCVRAFPCTSVADAAKVRQERGTWDGARAYYSRVTCGDVVRGGETVAHVSYNGRLWQADRTTPWVQS